MKSIFIPIVLAAAAGCTMRSAEPISANTEKCDAKPNAPLGNEWEQEQNLSLNKEKARAFFMTFTDLDSALKILPENSKWFQSLDGERVWKFKWSPNPQSRPKNFFEKNFSVSKWDYIRVPCSWQAIEANPDGKGRYGTPVYENQHYIFTTHFPWNSGKVWPKVQFDLPAEYSPERYPCSIGSYRRDFTVPKEWDGRQTFIKFDGVDSFFYLWINGEYVGFSKDSRNPAEFDITKYLKAGKNSVSVEVYRSSDASYLEAQDMFRMSGLFRSVGIYSTPKVRVRDIFVTAFPAKNKLDGEWVMNVDVELLNRKASTAAADYKVGVKMYTAAGKEVPLTAPKSGAWQVPVATRSGDMNGQEYKKVGLLVGCQSPALWSAETPNLYTVVVELSDAAGKITELIPVQFGFRKIEIVSRNDNGVRKEYYQLNGKSVKLRGVNRHESNPSFGHYVPRSVIEDEIRMMKEANINHVRNAHYPQPDYFYYLCNIYGIYVEDEANIESHGYYYSEHSLSHPYEWRDAHIDRTMNMVERNKNNPSVVLWSLGNEAGPGRTFIATEKSIKARDNTRPTQYERNNSIVDVGSNQYPGVGWVQWCAKNYTRAFHISEYAHNMMNAMGNLQDYQDAIESSDTIFGAAIWDWIDQAHYLDKNGKRILAYGGDFAKGPNDNSFACNGVILADRTPEPGYFEVKHVFQDINTSLDATKKNTINIYNRYFFRTLAAYDCKWELQFDGKTVQTGTLDVTAIKPRETKSFTLPLNIDALKPGSIAVLRVGFTLKEKEGLLRKGFELANDAMTILDRTKEAPVFAPQGSVEIQENEFAYTFTGKNFTAKFCKKQGTLVNYVVNGKTLIDKPISIEAIRCPSSNEPGKLGEALAQGLRVINQESFKFTKPEDKNSAKVFQTSTTAIGEQIERLDSNFGGGSGEPCKILPNGRTPSVRNNTHFIVNTQWTVYPDGSITAQSVLLPRGRQIELMRLGYSFKLPGTLTQVEYFGNGPYENYPDRKGCAFLGRYTDTTKNMFFPYGRPNDTGNRENTRWVSISDKTGSGILVSTTAEPFAFAALPYSVTELITTMHPEEMPEISDTTYLSISAVTRGLGGASCGPGPLDRDIPRANKPYSLDIAIRPATEANKAIIKIEPAQLDMTMPPPPETFTVIECTSNEPGNEGQKACDGDPESIWHTQYGVTLTKYPHSIAIDLNKVRNLKGFTVLNRQSGTNGMIKDYRVEVSIDKKTWTTVKEGSLKATAEQQKVQFGSTQKARYLRFTGLNEQNNQEFASIAELGIIE